MEEEERLCDEVETVRGFPCLGDRATAGGGCEVTGQLQVEDVR